MAGRKKSQWNRYNSRIKAIIKEEPNKNPVLIARQINEENNLHLNDTQIDLLRMYISRERSRQNLKHSSKKLINTNTATEKKATTWDEEDTKALWEYDGTQSITSLEQALAFSGVDTRVWEVERHIFNSWDVTSNQFGKKTNYQVKVWFRRKEELEIKRPEFRHIKIDKKEFVQMWVVIGCVHRPFHDKILWDKFLDFLETNRDRVTGILINGDYLDLRSLSSHEEWIPDGIDLSYEYSDGLQGIHEIEQALHSDVDKIFHYGNHEERFFRDKKSMRKYGKSLPTPHEALELDKRGWEVVTDWKNGYTTLGNKLDIFHGTKIGKNAAKDQLDALPTRDHIFNHTHRFSLYSNKTNTAYNLGWMGDPEHDMFKYVDRGTRQAWGQGFGTIYLDRKGNTHVTPIKVEKDRSFFFEGLIY